jgi:hypothetical protein
VAPLVEEEDSYYSEHSDNGELKEAYKTLYVEYEKLREGRKQHLHDLNSLQAEKSSLLQKIHDGDQGTASKDLVQVPIGPVTRARAKKFKDVLNRLIQELWAQANSWRPIEHDPRGQQRIVTLIQILEGSGQG